MRQAKREEEAGPKRASMVRRVAATCVDAGILMAVVLWLGGAYRNAGRWSGVPNETLWFYPVAGGLIVLAYQFLFLAAMQSTPGMVFLGLSLADSAGDRPTPAQVSVRILVSLLSAGAFGLGYAWALFQRQRRTWHDLAADTIVIRGSPGARQRTQGLPPRRSGPRTHRLG